MSRMHEFPSLLAATPAGVDAGIALEAPQGGPVVVRMPGPVTLTCRILDVGGPPLLLEKGDEVLVWHAPHQDTGVVLGRLADHGMPTPCWPPVKESSGASHRDAGPLVIETDGDLILRNRRARIRLGADGDIEIIGQSLTGRCHRWLRWLAPLIKLN